MPGFLEMIREAGSEPVVLVEEPDAVRSSLDRVRRVLEDDFERLRSTGEPAFGPDAFLVPDAELDAALATLGRVGVHAPSAPPRQGAGADRVDLEVTDHRPLSLAVRSDHRQGGGSPRIGSLAPLVEAVRGWLEEGTRVTLTAQTQGGRDRLVELLAGYGLAPATDGEAPLRVVLGPLTRGYHLPSRAEALVSEQEIFGPRVRRRRARRGQRRDLDDLRSLGPGDHVVHKVHGVGRFEGLVRREHDDVMLELLKVSYRDGDVLYVPVTSLDQVQKFTGGTPARLDRLGGESFARVKAKTRKAVEDLADRLLALYASRKAVSGRPLAARDRDYREFEAMFAYEETPDQERAIEEVTVDLERDTPMDRLLCGDVGFGKTEVAIRAAYRVAMAGRQVAVLVPTTVLAQQHLSTFRQRLSGTPLRVEGLSRFVSAAQRRETVKGVREGTVDVIVGTHRLLSRDVHFRDLGLLVIDEEHRFGVAQKERIKFLAPGTDVLHMTATPIPRTLQMSLGDVLDLSIISTPPRERRAVETHVVRRGDAVIRDAVVREMARGGQVFFVHNRVQTIGRVAEHLHEIVPEARMAVGHGQMGEGELLKVMLDFVSGRLDVLVCTSIIESGLDIPNANTVIIDDAHTFGLAQLYQIRGRVGRASEQAHAYLVVPRPESLTRDAAERIDTLVRFTALGSGFHVASMDLEIRGAGDLLGAEQSGHVRAVGFDMYCEMLRDAVDRLRGTQTRSQPEPELSLDVTTYIPDEYVEDPGQRMMLYKRMASAVEDEQVHQCVVEMRDRYGPLPDEVRELGRVMALKVLLRRLGAPGLEMTGRRLRLHLSDASAVDPDRLVALVRADPAANRLTPGMELVHRIAGDEPDRLQAARSLLESLLPPDDARPPPS
jgi:transcription-repair coupling factor (superfamily II helicase)